MMKLKTALLGVIVAVAGGCVSDPVPGGDNLATTNPAVTVDVLLEVDGYRVYRFYDVGRAHYFVTPEGTAVGTYSRSCGKNCRRTDVEEIQTAAR